MAEEFTVDVPIGGQGGTTSATSPKESPSTRELKKLNTGVKSLNKTMFLNIDVIEVITSLFGDLIKLFQPLIRVLSLLFLIIFLPLLPLFTKLTKALAKLTGVIGRVVTDPEGFVEKTGKGPAGIIAGILIAAGAVLLFALGGWIVALLGVIGATLIVFWDDISGFIKSGFEFILEAWLILANLPVVIALFLISKWEEFAKIPGIIWDTILKPAWEFLSNVGERVWNLIRDGLSSISNLGTRIWDFIKSALSGLGSGVKGFFGFDDFISRPGQSPVSFNPQDTIIGVKNPGSIGGTTVQINNPQFRNEDDMRKLVDMISRRLQNRAGRGFSSI